MSSEGDGINTNETRSSDLEEELSRVESQLKVLAQQIRSLECKKRLLEKRKTEITERLQSVETEKLKNQNWGRKGFSWSDRLDSSLRNVFGLHAYRPDQLAVMNASLSGHDVLLIMPTGGGKSLTYQLPAIVSPGVTLVVSPLLALMEDQLMHLKKLGVSAAMLTSTTGKEEKNRVMKDMLDRQSDLKLLYVTPEKCAKSKQFMTKLQKMFQMGRLERIAIDEVHCCSQWGHDFRTDYKFLGAMKGMFSEVPILGLTATSTAQVTNDVKEILRIPSAMVFLSGFNRPNLHYSVRLKPEIPGENYDLLANMLKTEFRQQSGIIYTTTIKEVETLTQELRKRGLKVGPYHAQMEPPSRRNEVHRAWLEGSLQAVVATVAFGMGIDKSNVRFVIHNTISKSMENFYQESGRAGRDDQPARCMLFFRLGDIFKQSTMVFTEQTGLEKLYAMAAYCLNANTCRRNIIAEHFLETWEPIPCNGMCDNCEDPGRGEDTDISDYGKAAVGILEQARLKEVRVTGLKLVEALMGRGASNIKLEGWKGGRSKEQVEMIVCHLIIEGFIKEDFHFTPYSTISYLVAGRRTVGRISMNLITKGGRANPAAGKQSSGGNKLSVSGKNTTKRIIDSDSDEDFVRRKKASSACVVISDDDTE